MLNVGIVEATVIVAVWIVLAHSIMIIVDFCRIEAAAILAIGELGIELTG